MDMVTSFHSEDDKLIVANHQDVSGILQNCAIKQDIGAVGSSDMKHAATIPMVIIEHYCKIAGITFQEWLKDKAHVKRMLNDPNLAAFRVWKGAI